MSIKNTKKKEPTAQKAPVAPAGINLKKRLLTAAIMIPIVSSAALYPQSWLIINIGKHCWKISLAAYQSFEDI